MSKEVDSFCLFYWRYASHIYFRSYREGVATIEKNGRRVTPSNWLTKQCNINYNVNTLYCYLREPNCITQFTVCMWTFVTDYTYIHFCRWITLFTSSDQCPFPLAIERNTLPMLHVMRMWLEGSESARNWSDAWQALDRLYVDAYIRTCFSKPRSKPSRGNLDSSCQGSVYARY